MPPNTALVVIDPYNDFLHQTGKVYPAIAESLTQTDTITHLKSLVVGARKAKIPVFYGLHQQYEEGFYSGWKQMTASHKVLQTRKVFEKGSFGAQFFEGLEPGPEDVVVSKHWNSSSFANTDLDYHLKQRGITHVVIAGLIAESCVDSTARYAYELGYHITMISDGTAAFSTAAQDALAKLIWPRFAERVLTTEEWTSELTSESSG